MTLEYEADLQLILGVLWNQHEMYLFFGQQYSKTQKVTQNSVDGDPGVV